MNSATERTKEKKKTHIILVKLSRDKAAPQLWLTLHMFDLTNEPAIPLWAPRMCNQPTTTSEFDGASTKTKEKKKPRIMNKTIRPD